MSQVGLIGNTVVIENGDSFTIENANIVIFSNPWDFYIIFKINNNSMIFLNGSEKLILKSDLIPFKNLTITVGPGEDYPLHLTYFSKQTI
jgi:hypothetical protein